MEAAISCNFHCKRLEGHWEGYWPDTDPAALTADIEERLAAATAAWGSMASLRAAGGWKVIDPKGVRRPPRRRVGPDRPSHDGGLPPRPGEAAATAERWLGLYTEDAEMDLRKAREWTRIRASTEAREGHDPGWATALRRMAAALG